MYVLSFVCLWNHLLSFVCLWGHLLRHIRNLEQFWGTWTSMLQPMCAHVPPCENWCSLIPTLFQTGSIFLTRVHLLSCKPILTSGKWVPLWWSQRIRFWFHILSLLSWWRILHILSRKMSCLHLSRSFFWNCPIIFTSFNIFCSNLSEVPAPNLLRRVISEIYSGRTSF